MTDNLSLYATRGTITNVTTLAEMRAAAENDESADALVTLAKERAFDASAFDRYPPVFFTVDASTDAIDAYSTIMADSTLNNFAADAAEGRSVLDSHNNRENGFGKSLTGTVVTKKTDVSTKAMRSSFFTISGYEHRGLNTDALIAGIQTGMHSDISVGFMIPAEDGRMTCSICGENMLDWTRCSHFAGIKYDVDIDDKRKERRVAIGTIENGRLNEYSLVYDGATPGAAVVKAIEMIEAGEVDRATAAQLERAYNRALPVVNRSWAVANRDVIDVNKSPNQQEPTDMELREQLLELASARGISVRTGANDEQIVASLVAHFDGLERDRENAETARDSAITDRDNARAELESSQVLIADGRAYREALIEQTLDAQVRALPEASRATFKRDVHKRYLMGMEVADIRTLAETYDAQSVFEPGANHSPSGTPDKPVVPKRRVPAIAHRDA